MGELEPEPEAEPEPVLVFSEMEGETDLLLPSELLRDLVTWTGTAGTLLPPFLTYLCLYFKHSLSSSFFLGLDTIFMPGPCRASTT